MAETIYTIPIKEAFEKREGCPLCRLERELETASLEYVSGAAMMEPDVRLETNRMGFCREHMDALLGMKNRLALALTLETHLQDMRALVSAQNGPGGKKLLGRREQTEPGKPLYAASESCYVCSRVSGFAAKYVGNTVHMWKVDPNFREIFAEQPYFCLEHGGKLLDAANLALNQEQYAVFRDTLVGIMTAWGEKLQEDISGFIRSFDHRYAGQPLTEDQRRSVENAADFLTGKIPSIDKGRHA